MQTSIVLILAGLALANSYPSSQIGNSASAGPGGIAIDAVKKGVPVEQEPEGRGMLSVFESNPGVQKTYYERYARDTAPQGYIEHTQNKDQNLKTHDSSKDTKEGRGMYYLVERTAPVPSVYVRKDRKMAIGDWDRHGARSPEEAQDQVGHHASA